LVDVIHVIMVWIYIAVWYVNTYIQYSDVLCITYTVFT